jgi:chemotaxis protein methyltransferase CheR
MVNMDDYEAFKKEIFALTQIDLSAYKEKQMRRRIDSLIMKNGFGTYAEYVTAIKKDRVLFEEFVNYLTINVSEFFRNPEQWEILEKELLPDILAKTRTPKIWSAACSTGDEPYTIVMLLSKYLPLSQIKILATDIDKQVIEKAKAGLYIDKSLKSVPKDLFAKYFTQVNEYSYKISDDIKRCVEFKNANLLKDPYPSDCDLIVCRNVLIYFTEEAKTDIYKKFNAALKKDGLLFVGSTEQIIQSYSLNYSTAKSFFYRKM